MKSRTLRDMVKIIREDLDNCVRPVVSGVKEATLGLLEGLYTPFLMSTGNRRGLDALNSGRNVKSWAQYISALSTFVGTGLFLEFLGIEKGRWKESLGALGVIAATNVFDYLQNAYRKAKELDELHRWQVDPYHTVPEPKRVYHR